MQSQDGTARGNARVFSARRVLTMDPSRPFATHVAVRDGRILAVGSLDEVSAWGPVELDDRFADRVIMPGLVEGHSHLMEGRLWEHVYCGYHDRRAPDGKLWTGLRDFDAVTERLRQAHAALTDPSQALIAWGFDPIYFGQARMTVRNLDAVSATRPIVVMHASLHLMNVNSAMLQSSGITRDTPLDGIPKFDDGEPTGELQEMAAMFPVMRVLGSALALAVPSEQAIWNFGRVAQLAGVTTATDLVNDLAPAVVDIMERITADDSYPLRLVPTFSPLRAGPADGVARVRDSVKRNHSRMIAGGVKFVVDGSIQGFTGRMRWPHYFKTGVNGLWVVGPDQLRDMIEPFHRAGMTIHIHTNGDEATDVALDAIEAVLQAHPRWDHRHTLQHCQMADASQFRRMKALGVCVNLFANHIYYWGDAHYEQTMGPDRALRLDACATALREGVPLAMHSDAPVTPIGPLFTAWCAVNRITSGGRLLGAGERIPVADALRAITLGAAYTLRLDQQVGSIEVGKYADFAVLDDDPLQVDPMRLKDIGVVATVLGGRVFQAPAA